MYSSFLPPEGERGGDAKEETVGELFTYCGTHSYVKACAVRPSVVNYKITETRIKKNTSKNW